MGSDLPTASAEADPQWPLVTPEVAPLPLMTAARPAATVARERACLASGQQRSSTGPPQHDWSSRRRVLFDAGHAGRDA